MSMGPKFNFRRPKFNFLGPKFNFQLHEKKWIGPLNTACTGCSMSTWLPTRPSYWDIGSDVRNIMKWATISEKLVREKNQLRFLSLGPSMFDRCLCIFLFEIRKKNPAHLATLSIQNAPFFPPFTKKYLRVLFKLGTYRSGWKSKILGSRLKFSHATSPDMY